MLMYCKMITTIALATSAILSRNYHFFFMVRTFKVYSLNKFQVYSTLLLTVVTTLYIRSLGPIHLVIESLFPMNISFFCHPQPWQPSFYSVSLSSTFF